MQTTLKVKNQAEIINPPLETRESIEKSLTIPNPAYAEAVRHRRWTGNIPEHIKLYEDTPEGMIVPRGWTRHAIEKLRQHSVDFIIDDQRRRLEPLSISFNGTLRAYQQSAVNDVLSRDFGVLEAATGSGKTVMALSVIAQRQQPAIVLVHTKELLSQWAERIRFFLDIDPGMVGGGKYNIKPLTVAMVKTARKYINDLPPHFGNLVVDECHHTPSTTFQEIVSGFDSKYMLGLSATAYRRDGLTRLIYLALGDRVHRVDPGLLQANGAVLAPEIITRETAFQYEYNDDYQAMISELIADPARNHLIARDIRLNTKSTTALVVSDRVEHLNTLAGMVDLPGMEILTGNTPAAERQRIVKEVNAGKVRVLFSTIQLIGEGFDCEGLADLYLTTPIRYEGRLIQAAGRILRPAEGKKPRIFDYVDAHQPVLNAQARPRARALKNMSSDKASANEPHNP